jgi:hypothetical protein
MMPNLDGSLHRLISRVFAFTLAKDFVWDYPQELPLADPARFDIGALIDLVREMLPTPRPPGRIVGTAIERFGRVDTLVNNAGAFLSKPFVDYSEADFAAMVGGESRRLLPRLATRGGGDAAQRSGQVAVGRLTVTQK